MKLVALLFVLTPWIFCQDSPRLGSVEGQLTDADLGKPLRGVDVLLVPVNSGGDSTANLWAKSQKDGKFFFPSVAPGSYFVTTDEEGVIYRHWKPSDPDVVARQFAVQTGERVTGVRLMWNAAVIISGRVLDPDGKPVKGAQVRASKFATVRGRRRLLDICGAVADEDGEYQMLRVQPGTLFLDAVIPKPSENGVELPAATSDTPDASQRSPELVRTFYPQAPGIQTAKPVTVAGKGEIANIDIQMHREKTYHLRGAVTNLQNDPVQEGYKIFLESPGGVDMGVFRQIQVSPEGKFDIAGLLPGTYELELLGMGPTLKPKSRMRMPRVMRTGVLARQDITIKSDDMNDLQLAVDPPIQLTGHLIVEGAEGVAPSGITMYLTALENPTGPTQFAYIDTDGSFEFRDPFPEQYALNIPRLSAGMYVKSVLFNGQNVKSKPIDLSHGGGEMKVILRSGTAEVSGSVPGQSRMMIALLPVQVGTDGSGVVNVVANGSEFEMKNVPPGGYHAYAFDDAAIKRYYLPLQNPEVLKTITQYATALELQENERRSISLTVVPFAAVQKAIMSLGLN